MGWSAIWRSPRRRLLVLRAEEPEHYRDAAKRKVNARHGEGDLPGEPRVPPLGGGRRLPQLAVRRVCLSFRIESRGQGESPFPPRGGRRLHAPVAFWRFVVTNQGSVEGDGP